MSGTIESERLSVNSVREQVAIQKQPVRVADIICICLLFADLLPTASIWLDAICTRTFKEALSPVVALIFLVVGAWSNRTSIRATPATKSWYGLGLLCICSIALNVVGFFKLFHLMVPLSILLAASFVWATSGLARLRSVFPLLFLSIFLLPDLPLSFRNWLSLPLQNIGTFLTVHFCRMFFPITGDTHFFVIGSQTYDVAPSCSGLSMLACFLFAFAIFQLFERPKRAAYICIFLIDPFLTMTLNTVRLIATAFFGKYVSTEFAIAVHSNLEFILVPIGLIALWLLGKKFHVIEEI